MLSGRGFAVFVGKECCVYFFKALKALSFLLAPPPYTASRIYYTAVLRYKLSWALEKHSNS